MSTKAYIIASLVIIATWFATMYFLTMYFLQEIQNNIDNPWVVVNLVVTYAFIFTVSVLLLLVALAIIEMIADAGKRI
jgi:xanthine/uracil permease